MRAISLWQPWATAMAIGAKRIETRSWETGYRGPIAIHAAKRRIVSELRDFEEDSAFAGALWQLLKDGGHMEDVLPFGEIVAIGELVDCKKTEEFAPESLSFTTYWASDPKERKWTERDMGDFHPGRFGWVFTDIRALQTPIPFRGSQGLFHVPEELIRGAA